MMQRFLDIIRGYDEQLDAFLTACETPGKIPVIAHVSNPWNGLEWNKDISGGLLSLPPVDLAAFKETVLGAAEKGEENLHLSGQLGWIMRALEVNNNDVVEIPTRSALSWVAALEGSMTPERGNALTCVTADMGAPRPDTQPEP